MSDFNSENAGYHAIQHKTEQLKRLKVYNYFGCFVWA